jgi:hypothetical protein
VGRRAARTVLPLATALPLALRGEYDIHSAARLEKPSCINRDG